MDWRNLATFMYQVFQDLCRMHAYPGFYHKKWQAFIALPTLSKGWLNIYDTVCHWELSMTQEGD